jgi:hypothetical protein
VNAGKEEDDRFRLTVNYEKNSLGWWSRKLNNNEVNLDDDYENKNYDEDENKEIPIMLKGSIDGKVYKTLKEELKLEGEGQYSSKVTLEQFKVEGNDILSLNLQLNQLLMLLNNPMLFPHYAYAKAFNGLVKKG